MYTHLEVAVLYIYIELTVILTCEMIKLKQDF